MALQVQAFDDIGSEIWLLKFCEKLCFNRYVALFHLVWRGFYLLLDVSPVVLLMEPVQDAHLEMYQSLRECVELLQSNCRQIKSSRDSMISTLGSTNPMFAFVSWQGWAWQALWMALFCENNQSLTMILGASDEEAPDEPPSKRPRTSDPPTRDELYLEPGDVLYFGG